MPCLQQSMSWSIAWRGWKQNRDHGVAPTRHLLVHHALTCVPTWCCVRFGATFFVRSLSRRGSSESFWAVFVVAGKHDMDVFELRMWLVLRSVEERPAASSILAQLVSARQCCIYKPLESQEAISESLCRNSAWTLRRKFQREVQQEARQ